MSVSLPASMKRGEFRRVLAGGVVAAAGVFAVAALVGTVSSSFEARTLVEGIKSTALFAASTYIASGATILALIATVVSFSLTHDSEFRTSHYRRLRLIASCTTALIIVAIALLTCLSVPIAQADVETSGYVYLYWAIVALGSIGGGLVVSIVLMLNYAVRGLVSIGLGASFLTIGHGELDDEYEELAERAHDEPARDRPADGPPATPERSTVGSSTERT